MIIKLKQLLTENTGVSGTELVARGLSKVFANGGPAISYTTVENIGLGYIKSVSEAQRIALQEAKALAPKFGYSDDENNERFVKTVKEDGEMSSGDIEGFENGRPMVGTRGSGGGDDESREIEIGKEILSVINEHLQHDLHPFHKEGVEKIKVLAQELIQMHGAK